FKMRIQCFKVTPFSLGNQKFITFDQIIPQKDTADYVIRMAEKNQEEIAAQEGLQNRHLVRMDFWSKILPLLKGRTRIFQNVNPSKDHWLSSTADGFRFTMVITKFNASVLLEFSKPSKEENKNLFDAISSYKEEIEAKFGNRLNWRRMDDKISSHISFTLND